MTNSDERIRVALGAVGDEAASPRPFDRIAGVDDRTTTRSRRPFTLGITAALVVTAGAIGVWQVTGSTDDPTVTGVGSIVSSDVSASIDPASTPAPTTTSTTSTATSVDTGNSLLVGPWYTFESTDITADELTVLQPDVLPGSSTTIWATEDGSFRAVLVLHRFASDPGFTTLTGTTSHEQFPLPGTLELISDPSDPPDPQVPSLVGDEARWTLEDGGVMEFRSYGLGPSLLSKDVAIAYDRLSDGCPCDLPGLVQLATDTGAAVTRQEFMIDGSTMTLSRSSTSPAAGLGDPTTWTATAAQTIDGLSGALIDGTRAVWKRDGFWFTLEGMPPERADEMLASLRRIGSAPSALVGASSGLIEGWNRLPDPPLTPRSNAVMAVVDDHLLVVGGDEQLHCDDTASCVADAGRTFSDGAAYNVVSGDWSPISPAPIAFAAAGVAVVREDIYVLVQPTMSFGDVTAPGHLLRYDLEADAWDEVPGFTIDRPSGIVAVSGNRLVVYARETVAGSEPDAIFDPSVGTWDTLPNLGLVPMSARSIRAGGYTLVVSGWATDPVAGDTRPVVATYQFGAQGWVAQRDIPAMDQIWVVDRVVVGEPQPDGGRLDLRTGTDEISTEWSALAAAPDDPSWTGDLLGVTSIEAASFGGEWLEPDGWVYDLSGDRWLRVPAVDDSSRSLVAETAIGRHLAICGGSRISVPDGAELTNECWIWVPPAP